MAGSVSVMPDGNLLAATATASVETPTEGGGTGGAPASAGPTLTAFSGGSLGSAFAQIIYSHGYGSAAVGPSAAVPSTGEGPPVSFGAGGGEEELLLEDFLAPSSPGEEGGDMPPFALFGPDTITGPATLGSIATAAAESLTPPGSPTGVQAPSSPFAHSPHAEWVAAINSTSMLTLSDINPGLLPAPPVASVSLLSSPAAGGVLGQAVGPSEAFGAGNGGGQSSGVAPLQSPVRDGEAQS